MRTLIFIFVAYAAYALPGFANEPDSHIAPDSRVEIDKQYSAVIRKAEATTLKSLMKPVSVEWVDISVADAVTLFNREFGLNILLDGSTLPNTPSSENELVTFIVEDVAARELLDMICRVRNLSWSIDGSFVIVADSDSVEPKVQTRIYDVSRILTAFDDSLTCDDEVLCATGICMRFRSLSQVEVTDVEQFEADGDDAESLGRANVAYRANTLARLSALADLLQRHTDHDCWKDYGGEGVSSPILVDGKPLLVVDQTARKHLEIAAVLERLEAHCENTNRATLR